MFCGKFCNKCNLGQKWKIHGHSGKFFALLVNVTHMFSWQRNDWNIIRRVEVIRRQCVNFRSLHVSICLHTLTTRTNMKTDTTLHSDHCHSWLCTYTDNRDCTNVRTTKTCNFDHYDKDQVIIHAVKKHQFKLSLQCDDTIKNKEVLLKKKFCPKEIKKFTSQIFRENSLIVWVVR